MTQSKLVVLCSFLALAACGKSATPPVPVAEPAPVVAAPKPERRPFKELLDAVERCDETNQRCFITDLAKGLRSHRMASFSEVPVPDFLDLVGELMRRGKQVWVYALLRDENLECLCLGDLIEFFVRQDDPEAFRILLSRVDGGPQGLLREQAVHGIGGYLKSPEREPRAYRRLVELLQGDPDPRIRGRAAMWLGDSPRPEVVAILNRALDDKAEILSEANEEPGVVNTVASRAEESLKRLPKQESTVPQ